jgi:hypothetical protein
VLSSLCLAERPRCEECDAEETVEAERGGSPAVDDFTARHHPFDDTSADVVTSPRFKATPPRVLFKLPGLLGGNLGNVSRDGQRFVFAVNIPAAGTR